VTSDTRRTFRLQKRFIVLETAAAVFVSGIIVLSWIPAALSFASYGVFLDSTVKAAIYINATTVIILLFMSMIKRELHRIEYILTNDRIIIKSPYRMVTVRFSEIRSVRILNIFPGREILKINSDNSPVRIPLFLEKNSSFLELLESGLMQQGKSEAIDTAEFSRAKSRSEIYYRDYLCSLKVFYPLVGFSIFLFLANILISELYWDMDLIRQLLWSVYGLFFPVSAYALCRWHINRTSFKNSSDLSKRRVAGQKDYLIYGFISLLIFMISGICFRLIFQIS